MSKDNRNWSKCNEELVRRGEIELDAKIMEEWKEELKKENEGKVGEPFHYPEPYIRLLAFVRLLFHLPYRQTEGFVTFLSKHIDGLKAPDYSALNRRVNKLQIELDDSLLKSNDPVSIAVDSSGVKVHNSGDWMRHVWKVRKGYLKIHFAVNIKTKQVVSMDVTSEKVHDSKRLKRLVNRAKENGVRVKGVLADGAYDPKDDFKFLSDNGIKSVSDSGATLYQRVMFASRGKKLSWSIRHSNRNPGRRFTDSDTGGEWKARISASR